MGTKGRSLTDQAGFTLVELLAVMLILAVLAGLAIPAFFGQAAKSRDSVAKQAVDTAQTAMEVVGRERPNGYLGISAADLRTEEPSLASAALAEPATTETTYTLQVVSSSGTAFSISRVSPGGLEYDCAPQDTGGCPLGGDWSGGD
jgi:prepilin-type N-terminal cleavage/methylation domain-containing protein